MNEENGIATMPISSLFVAVNLSEIHIVMSEKRMKKSKMCGENQMTTIGISPLFVAVNLPEIYRVLGRK